MIDILKPFDSSGETEGDKYHSSLSLEKLFRGNKFGRSRSSKSSVGICASGFFYGCQTSLGLLEAINRKRKGDLLSCGRCLLHDLGLLLSCLPLFNSKVGLV